MPGTIALLLPSQSVRTPKQGNALQDMIPLPVDLKAGTQFGMFFEEGAEIPEQFLGAVKWVLPKDKTLQQVCGEGVAISDAEGGRQLAAERDGALVASDAGLKVAKVFEIMGDLNKQTGNVETLLPVLIHGSLSHGVMVKSKGDVEILGLIEEARIESEGSIQAKGGVTGGGAAKLTARNDVRAQFVQNASIEAGGNVTVEAYLMNSSVLCGKKVILPGQAFMVGGKVMAAEGMEAGRIGSEAAVTSEIELGKNPFLNVQRENIGKNVNNLEREVEVLTASIRYAESVLEGLVTYDEGDAITSLFTTAEVYKREAEKLDDEKKQTLEKFGGSIMTLMRKKDELAAEKTRLEDLAKGGANSFNAVAKLAVSGVAHPGAMIRMSDAVLKLDREYDSPTFYYKKAEGDRQVGEVAIR